MESQQQIRRQTWGQDLGFLPILGRIFLNLCSNASYLVKIWMFPAERRLLFHFKSHACTKISLPQWQIKEFSAPSSVPELHLSLTLLEILRQMMDWDRSKQTRSGIIPFTSPKNELVLFLTFKFAPIYGVDKGGILKGSITNCFSYWSSF